jgi:hypothetical protein
VWLDVGTGYGHFCKIARKVWPDTIFDGLDQSVSVDEAQRRGWVDRRYRGEFVALGEELAGRYDVVSMYHYLEHAREPFDELDVAAKVLQPDGFLIIEVPNPDYHLSRTFGRMWSQWCQPQHQHMFPLENLVRALTIRGLSLVTVKCGAAHLMGADLLASVVLLLNVCAGDPRLPWLAVEPIRWWWVRRTAAWVVGMPLLAGACFLDPLLYWVARCTRNGNAYRVLARKDS